MLNKIVGQQIKVPKFVISLMSRAKYDYRPRTTPGYSIAIHKRTKYSQASTLLAEVKRLCAWADKNTPDGMEKSSIIYYPTETYYEDQFAVVTILDPVMKAIEKFINNK